MNQGHNDNEMKVRKSSDIRSRKHKRKLSKHFVLLVSLVLLVSIAAGATIAYFTTDSKAATSSFEPGVVACSVSVDGNGRYYVSNVNGDISSNVPVYIRAAVVVNWTKEGDSSIVLAKTPEFTVDADSDWKLDDNYYYYTGIVATDDDPVYLCTVTAGTAPAGYELSVEVVAEAIQAEGTDGTKKAVVDAWGIDPETLG